MTLLLRIAAFAVLLFLLGGAAQAHAILQTATPADGASLDAPPTRVVLTFSEPVTPLAFRLLRPDGEIVRLPDPRADGATIEAPLALEGVTGTAILNWRVASADGHPVGGSITFTIGAGTEPAQELAWSTYRAPSWAARFLLMVGLFASVGAILFRYWVFAAERRGDMRLAAGAAGLGALSLAAFVYAQAVDVSGLGASGLRASDVWNALLVNGFGLGAGLAGCALVLALVCATGGVSGAAGRWLSAAAAAAVVAAFVAYGHARAAEPAWLMQPAIALHVAAVLFWLGSFAPLLNALRSSPGEGATALARFSLPIFVTSAVLLLTGFVMAWAQLGAVSELWSSAYGVVLLAKLALVAPMFALGAVNRFALAGGVAAGRPAAIRRLRRTIAAELLLGVLTLGVVGLWRFTPPPRSMEAVTVTVNGLQFHAHGVRAMANLELSPARVGRSKATVNVLNIDATPLAAREVTVVLLDPLGRLEPIRRPARRLTDASWVVDEVSIPSPGRWTVRVDILISDFEQATVRTSVNVVR